VFFPHKNPKVLGSTSSRISGWVTNIGKGPRINAHQSSLLSMLDVSESVAYFGQKKATIGGERLLDYQVVIGGILNRERGGTISSLSKSKKTIKTQGRDFDDCLTNQVYRVKKAYKKPGWRGKGTGPDQDEKVPVESGGGETPQRGSRDRNEVSRPELLIKRNNIHLSKVLILESRRKKQ